MAAEGVLVDIASKFLGYLGQSAFQEVASWLGVKGDLKKFEQSLSLIKARITDAEKRQEGENSAAIKEWLRRLRAVLYRADDLFDDLYIAQQRKQRTKGNMAKKVRLLFSSSTPVLFNIELARELKSIRRDLDDIKSDMDGLNLSVCDHRGESRLQMARLMSKRETTSFVQPDEVVGREDDKDAIISMLLDPVLDEQNNPVVIPIVGFGGIGKTTLAQLVFNDERVKHHFELTKWACVPMIDDHKEFMRKVFSSFIGIDHQGCSLEDLQSRFRESINDKKYLLVLDDIWDEDRDRWLSLMSLLRCGSKGSKIIVTARSHVVAEIVGTGPAYELGLLADEVSWNLFRRLAFKEGQEEDNPNLTKIGKEIVDRCANVPLAIRVMGSLLYSKDSEQEWLFFRDAHLSKTKITGENKIMPELKLSYDFLPSPLKQCFAYCSVFPKDYEFEKTELVRLWMAQGYIEPYEKSLSLEDVGGLYFLELQRRNLFQEHVDEYGDVIYKMHDLVHDLALHVAGAEDVLEEKRFGGSFDEGRSSSSLLTMRKMRSLVNSKIALSSLREMNPSFQSIRALSLKGFAKSTLPYCIGRLRRLRYLNLENSILNCLPNFIVELECLQTLNLDNCQYLKRWPRGFSNLANLRHLQFRGCEFRDMPSGFEKMKSLVELNKFIVGEVCGRDTLVALDLKGYYVEIDFYKCCRNSVSRVNMKDIHKLRIRFFMEEETSKSGDMELLLECLILPSNLEELEINFYSGERFPTWMLPNLDTVKIYNCKSCVQLPQFSQLPFLRSLELQNLEALEYIEEDGWGGDGESCSATHFTALEVLFIYKMPKLKGWFWRPRVKDDVHPVPQQAAMTSDVHQDFTSHRLLSLPRLSHLNIYQCPQFIVSMPLLPRLEEFNAQNIHEKGLESLLASHREAPSSSFPSSFSSPTLSTLKHLTISNVNIVSFSINFFNLETLSISNCEKLTSLIVVSPNSSIQKLSLSELKNLRALPEDIGHLSQLRQLTIWDCPELASLPQSLRGLSSLQSLRIGGCPHLKTRCRKPDGEDWPLIQHIAHIKLS